jgi:hypothetical protein
MLDFGVRVEDRSPYFVINETHGQRTSQLTLAGFVQTTSLEATSQNATAD